MEKDLSPYSKKPSFEPKGWYSRNFLPHFDVPGAIQHISYHLYDSLPKKAVERMKGEAEALPLSEEKRKLALLEKIQTYLDAGYGSCILKHPQVAQVIEKTWFHFDGQRYHLLEWVVMPNHCHVLIEPFEGISLGKIVLSWKNYTARFINKFRASHPETQGEGNSTAEPVWWRELFDRYIRGERHYQKAKEYILMNPVNAGLVQNPEQWPWSSANQRKTP